MVGWGIRDCCVVMVGQAPIRAGEAVITGLITNRFQMKDNGR